MIIQVLLFARAKELLHAERISVDLPAAATVGALRSRLSADFPTLAGLLPRSAIAVNEEFASDATAIPPGATVALLPPVSGGQ